MSYDSHVPNSNNGPRPSFGSGPDAAIVNAEAAARLLLEETRARMEACHRPQQTFGACAPVVPPTEPFALDQSDPTDSSGSLSGRGGEQQPAGDSHITFGGPILVVGLILVAAHVPAVLVALLLAGIFSGALLETLLIWPVARRRSRQDTITFGLVFQSGLLSACAYAGTLYLIRHFAGPALDRLDVHWIGPFAFSSITQVAGLLASGGVIALRLASGFGGVRGFLKACAVSGATVLILAVGATLCVDYAPIQRDFVQELAACTDDGRSEKTCRRPTSRGTFVNRAVERHNCQ